MTRLLRDALRDVAKRVEHEGTYKGKDDKLHSMNKSAVELFESPHPVFRRVVPGEPAVNVRLLALWRADRYIRRRGINWRLVDWETLVEWLYDNWDKILRVLFSLLVLI